MSTSPQDSAVGDGKVAIVTGAAQGIGRASALRLARNGYRVAIADLQKEKAEKVVGEIQELGLSAVAYGLDVSDGERVRETAADVVNRFGRIDVLVNNAGTHRECEVIDLTDELYERIVGTVLTGTFLFSRAVLPTMIAQKSGVIVNISSVWAWGTGPGAAPYCAAKAGVSSFTKTLAIEVGKHGIRVCAIAPGLIETDMYETVNEEERAAQIAGCPLGRLASPDEIAGPLSFLVSDEASWITGDTLTVSGGTFLR
jgi:3-oxoacyl-[acyl-carrier protein] reductase